MDKKDLAKAILQAIRIRENSFSDDLVRKATRGGRKVNSEMFYSKSYIEAADDAIEALGLSTDWTQVIALLIRHNSLAIESWARFVLEDFDPGR